ncbi:DUF305 domain-containing protein [Micromonospora costi]|uniref:DUF305 domain-containing protein n=1 Tax=Micromonospora costi TaxID=1530042 RepID=A0A3A9ZP66_9ACTN|nr:DUF305 domain-containing protein [Micromonospora costi]RKN50002.1 DUF305 domain-containing protein [Micromonospora costi]
MRAGLAVPSALLATALLLAGCAAAGGSADPSDDRRAPAAASAPPGATTGTPVGGTTAGAFSATDVAWLQLTVAMAERLLPVLDLVPARTRDPAWRGLAAGVADTHRGELSRARRLLADSGAPATNPHEGHDMPGMATAEDLAALRVADGPAFERLVAGHLRAHLGQAVRVARAEQGAGTNPATIALAAAAVREGTAELARLDRLDRPARAP